VYPSLSTPLGDRLIERAERAWSALREPTGKPDGGEPNVSGSGSPADGRLRSFLRPGKRTSEPPEASLVPNGSNGSNGSKYGSRVRVLRVLLGDGEDSGVGGVSEVGDIASVARPRGGFERDVGDRLRTEVAVVGRSALIALATIAGTVDAGNGGNGGNERHGPQANGTDLAGDDSSHETATPGRRLRENGPGALVPLAWSFAVAAHLGLLADRTVLIAHLVMDSILASFAAASWSEMTEGVLRAWKLVLLVGLGVTLLGTAALLGRSEDPSFEVTASTGTKSGNEAALALTVVAWMLVPAAGLAYTGLRVEESEAPRVYLAGAVLSALGGLAYASAPSDTPAALRKLLGLTLANVGQTAGIVNAIYQY
jgi:hypothetical protein